MTLREIRSLNYRVKRFLNFTCTAEDCDQDHSLLVVRVAPGEGIESFTVRCEAHLEDFPVNPGQWTDGLGEEKAAA